MTDKHATPEDVLLKLSEACLKSAEAIEALAHKIEQQFEDLHGCLRDGIYSEGFDPEEFHRLRLDVTEIERRTREVPNG